MSVVANSFKFLSQVRAELVRVVWPTRKETAISSVMVAFLVLLAVLFLSAADFSIGALIRLSLNWI